MSNSQRVKPYFCIGYGGAPSVVPPGHTLTSLRKAIEVGAGMLHVEIRATREVELVASTSLQREHAGKPRFLREHTLPEWRRMTAKEEDPILALGDVLALAARTRCGLLLDLREQGLENALARKLKASGLTYANVLVASDTDLSRQLLRSLDPRIPLAHRFHMDHQALVTPDLLRRLDTDAVLWPSEVINRNIVRVLKAKGVMVYAGVVSLAEEMRRLIDDCGIDGLSTRYPDLLLTFREDKAA